jgi:hypothetical protein
MDEQEIQRHMEDADRRHERARPPVTSAQIERKFERGYFTIKDAIAMMEDTVPDDPEHLRRVFFNIRAALDEIERLLD